MTDESYQLIALVGFVISGILFFIVAWQGRDYLTLASSVVWIVACGLFAYPLLRNRR